ncbi:MAG: hypothetical protein HKP16_09805 [Xanthomonadales bacterium]|nr:hypothetical protein [Xanthomonadales bacterium]
MFEDDEVIDLTLTGPFGALLETKQNPAYLPFRLETGETSLPVEIRVRGHSRLRICDFPPLRLRFPPDAGRQGIFGGHDRLKLVTHCHDHDRAEQDLLEEYSAYRIFNAATPLSYRVRLLRVRYRDSEAANGIEPTARYAFLLEPRPEFAARTTAKQVELAGFPKERHDREHAALMYVLQYLIANTDWMLLKADYDDACCHNADLFERGSKIFFVPYDFDLVGLVNARYAHPDPRLRIRRVTQRRYRGLCTDREYLSTALARVVSRREQILDAVRTLPDHEPRNARRAERFLGDFFEDAADAERLLRSFERRCLERY